MRDERGVEIPRLPASEWVMFLISQNIKIERGCLNFAFS
jgi:hypothetical protein